MIAIHLSVKDDFSHDWKSYCEQNRIAYKLVNCYDTDIIGQLQGCKALLWHINHVDYRDQLFAKDLIKSLAKTNIKLFPNSDTVWHFDDKLAQKYLLEAIKAPMVASYVFFDKKKALEWISVSEYPKVFKLRKGAGSSNVLLVRNQRKAKSLITKAFGRGFPTSDKYGTLKERFRLFNKGKESFFGLIKGIGRLFIEDTFTRMSAREKGYAYFQEFLPNNDHDQRIIVIGGRAIGLKRMVRENDFRASGSGSFFYDKELFDLECVRIAFKVSKDLKCQSLAFDFIFDTNKKPKIVEVSYAFNKKAYYGCLGYWDDKLFWHEGNASTTHWILQDLLKEI